MTWLDYVVLGASIVCLAISGYLWWMLRPSWHKETLLIRYSPLSTNVTIYKGYPVKDGITHSWNPKTGKWERYQP